MKKRFYGKITYTIDKNHPDIKHVKDWTSEKIYDFEDVYFFADYYDDEDCIGYIKRDLRLVAGGGYNSDYIHNVLFEIRKL